MGTIGVAQECYVKCYVDQCKDGHFIPYKPPPKNQSRGNFRAEVDRRWFQEKETRYYKIRPEGVIIPGNRNVLYLK